MSEMYPPILPAPEILPGEAKDNEDHVAHLDEMDPLRKADGHGFPSVFEAPPPTVCGAAPPGNGVVQPAPKPGLLSSQMITIRWFPRATPEGEAGFANAYYKETLKEYADDPDFVLRLAAVDADRIDEPAIWEAVLAADIVVAYELFYPDMYVVSGINTWEALMRGDLKRPTVILPLCTYLKPDEFQNTVLQVRNAKGIRTCEGCGGEV